MPYGLLWNDSEALAADFMLKHTSGKQPSRLSVLHVSMILSANDMQGSQDIVLLLWMYSWARRAALCKGKRRTLMVMWTSWRRWIAIVSSSVCRENPQAKRNRGGGGGDAYWHGSSRMSRIKSALVLLIDSECISCVCVCESVFIGWMSRWEIKLI